MSRGLGDVYKRQMQEALAAGAEKVSDGWGMLVEQGAESFRLWTNLIPDTSRLLEKPID